MWSVSAWESTKRHKAAFKEFYGDGNKMLIYNRCKGTFSAFVLKRQWHPSCSFVCAISFITVKLFKMSLHKAMSGFDIQAPTFLSRLFVPDEWRAFRKPAVVDQRVGFFLDGVSSCWTRDSPPLNGPLMVIRAGSLLRRTWRGISEEQVIHQSVKALLYLFRDPELFSTFQWKSSTFIFMYVKTKNKQTKK